MMYIDRVLSYYQECYRQEFKDGDILNFTGSKVEKRIFLDDIDTFYTEDNSSFLSTDIADELYKFLEVYKKTKTLLSCSFFITGKLNFLGKKQSICAPLITRPVRIGFLDDGRYFFDYNFYENKINETLLNIIKSNFSLDDSFIIEVKEALENGDIKHIKIEEITKVLQKYIKIENDLESLPQLLPIQKLRNKAKSEKLQILPTVALGVVEKSKSNKGVLNEIEEIKQQHLYNESLNSLFSRRKEANFKINEKQQVFVPSNLSEAQKNIIKAVNSNCVTVVVGPPGTGKSYTIASLALDQVYQDKSVLICSKTDQAVDVLHNKIVHDIGVKGLSIRAGSGRSYKSALSKKLESILSYRKSDNKYNINLQVKEKTIVDAFKKIDSIKKEINSRESSEINKAELFISPKLSFFKRIKKNFITSSILKEVPFWQLVDLLSHYILQKNRLIKEAITYKYQYKTTSLLTSKRKAFQDVLSILKSKDQKVKNVLYDRLNFKPILECLPIWISKSTDIDLVLPLEKDLFDVAIIDEASQCDIASMIPILVRAKKIVIVGDQKQLRHVSFLSQKTLENTAEKLGLLHEVDVLNYRQNSFLDYAIHHLPSQENIHFLDEHYRSLPSIIQYSNANFYDNRLKIMSSLHIHQKASAIKLVECFGTKNKRGVNEEEAKKIITDIKKLIHQEEVVTREISTTIGVLSPFRDQVNYLKKKIQELDLSAIKKHKIQVGTPFEFQGEERDIMFISFTIDNETSSSVFQYLDREDVFNVSITRAKNQQHLYYSFNPKNFKNHYLLIDYLSDSKIKNEHINSDMFNDPFATDVYEELIALGINENDIKLNFVLAGYTIDLLLTHNNKTVCIDLVGYPGEFEKTFSIAQYKTLFRTNVPIITIPYAYWKLKKEACLTHIKKKLRL